MSTLFDGINLNEKYKYTIIQTYKSKVPIGILTTAFDRTLSPNIDSIGVLTFSLPKYIEEDLTHKKIENPEYNSIQTENMILLKTGEPSNPISQGYYIIKNLTEDTSNCQMTVECKSAEQILENNTITIDGIERELVNNTNKNGILNLVEAQTSWKIGHVDASALIDVINGGTSPRVRWISALSKSVLSFLHDDICPAYNIIIMYDTFNKLINVYDRDNYGINSGIIFSEENYAKSTNKSVKSDNVYTRFECSGLNQLTINTETLDGSNFVTNYDYYIAGGQMSPALVSALANYNALLIAKDVQFKVLKTQLDGVNASLVTKNIELDALIALQKSLDGVQASYMSVTPPDNINLTIQTPRCNANKVATTAKKAEIASLNAQVVAINIPIAQIGTDIAKPTAKIINTSTLIFTPALIEELSDWTLSSTFSSDVYVTPALLKKAAEDALKIANIPVTEFTMSLIDFFAIAEAQHIWGKIKLGDLVRVYSPKLKANIDVRIISYSYNIDTNALSIIFSNKNKKIDNAKSIGGSIAKSLNAAKYLNLKRLKWDETEGVKNRVDTYLSNALNCSAQDIIALSNMSKITINENGIFIVEKGNENNGICILAGLMCITHTGFLTVDTAINSQGVAAEQIIGRLLAGEKLVITNENGSVVINGTSITIKDEHNTVVLSAKGVVNSDNFGFPEQVDASNPYVLDFNIDENVNVISQVLLKLTVQNFRAYETAAPAGGGGTTPAGGGTTTPSGGGSTTPSGGGNTSGSNLVYSNSSTSYVQGWGVGGNVPVPTVAASVFMDRGGLYDATVGWDYYKIGTETGGAASIIAPTVNPSGTSECADLYIMQHKHNFSYSIPPHTHSTPNHTHATPDHQHSCPNHTHQIPDHLHSITYGIYQKPLTLGAMQVYVDGVWRMDLINIQQIVDLSSYLTVRGWHQIIVTSPAGLNRFLISLSLKTYIGA